MFSGLGGRLPLSFALAGYFNSDKKLRLHLISSDVSILHNVTIATAYQTLALREIRLGFDEYKSAGFAIRR